MAQDYRGGGSNRPKPTPKKPAPLAGDIRMMEQLAAKNAQDEVTAFLGQFELPMNWMGGAGGGGGGGEIDYVAEARRMFAPQFDYLDQQGAAAQQRAKQNQAALAALYGATAKDILGQQTGIKQNFTQGMRTGQQAYQQGTGAVGGAFDKSRNDQLAILKRLGIEQAAPNTLQENAGEKAFIQSIMAANNMANTNMLNQMQQGALAFNTEQGNITKQEGANQQAGVGRQLEDLLMQIAGRKADINSEMNKTAFGMRSEAEKNAIARQSQEYDRWKDERDFNYRMGKDKADYDLQLRRLAGSEGADETELDPLGAMQQLALQLYGGNREAAGNASQAVQDALLRSSQEITSPADLIRAVLERNPNANDQNQLARLAAEAFKQMYGKGRAAPYYAGY